MKYVSLHHHSTFSYMDGFGTPAQHVARAADLGMGALALTEHGNVSSHARLEQAALKVGVKPIFGLEAYTAPVTMRADKNTRKWHLTILAADLRGYHNLCRIVTKSWAEGFYMWPTVLWPTLAEHHEGLIVLSGCADSKLACDLLGGKGRETGDWEDACRTVERFVDLLDDRFYLEVQAFPELERTRQINPAYAELSKRYGVPLVATQDVHYPMPDDNEMQKILHAAGRNIGTVAAAEASWEYDIRLTLPESDRAILERLKGTGLTGRLAERAILATAEIATRINVSIPKAETLRYPLNDGLSSTELIWDWLRKGWRYRSKFNPALRDKKEKARYIDRLHYEMEMIEGKDFIDYFLMLSDAVSWAKDNGIAVGPARGSAAASLVCYLLRITEVDPMAFPYMLFERFVDVNRVDLPDVDLDFDDARREELRFYLAGKYGADHVGNIGTFTRYRGKNALIDVARTHNIPDYEIQVVKDLMIERSGGDSRFDASLEDTVEMFPQAKEAMDKFPDLYKALKLEGNYRGMSVHAAGLVVSNSPLTDTVALYERESAGVRRNVLSVDKYDAEYLGLMKADFLGLSTMGAIALALEEIGMTLEDLYSVPLDDEETLAGFRRNDVTGVFQFTGGATRIVNGDVKPDNFLELADVNSLSRPGPLHSGSTQEYIDVKFGRREPEHFHPIVDRITAHTRGQIIYQEQVLQIVREVGDFSWMHAGEIRKIISKKLGEAQFNEKAAIFCAGADKLHGMKRELALRIWKRLVTSAQYSFNFAHAASYAMIGYWNMWLKVHHPTAFYAASLRKFPKDQFGILRDALKHGVKALPPHPNKSGENWKTAKNSKSIRAGFLQVPKIGAVMSRAIVQEREEQGNFTSWDDMRRVRGVGPTTVERLQEMASSEDPFEIHRIDQLLGSARESIAAGELGPLPIPTHYANTIPRDSEDEMLVTFLGIPLYRNPQDIVEDERARTGESVDSIIAGLSHPELTKKMVLRCVDESDELVYVRFNRFVFPRLQRKLWDIKLGTDVVLVRGYKKPGFGTGLYITRQKETGIWILKNRS